MAPKEEKEYRLFCLCGQKMKITPGMYGQRGKCISCGQKFFVPEEEELGAGSGELRLENYPELLRAGKGNIAEDANGAAVAVPLDTLPVLLDLLSREYDLAREFRAAMSLDSQDGALGYVQSRREEIRVAREKLHDVLEAMRNRVEDDLAATTREMNTLREAAASASMDAATFVEEAEGLRRRRERLAWRRANLEGWLAADHPTEAGGHQPPEGVAIAPIPDPLVIPEEPLTGVDPAAALISRYTNALEVRRNATTVLDTLSRGKPEEDEAALLKWETQRLNAEAVRERAIATLRHVRVRMKEMHQSILADLGALSTQLDLLHARRGVGELSRREAATREQAIQTARTRLKDAAQHIREGMEPPKHAIERPRNVVDRSSQSIKAAPWLIWVSALLLLASAFLPLTSSSLVGLVRDLRFGSPWLPFVLAAPLGGALVLSVAGLLRGGTLRHLACLSGIVILLGAGVLLWREGPLLASPVGVELRTAGDLLARPAMLTYNAGLLFLLGACAISAQGSRGRWLGFWLAVFACALTTIAVLTNFGGLARPIPEVRATLGAVTSSGTTVTLYIRNQGVRAFTLGETSLPNVYRCRVRTPKQDGGMAEVRAFVDADGQASSTVEGVNIGPGEEAALQCVAPPGDYEVTLDGQTEARFTIAKPPAPPAASVAPPPSVPAQSVSAVPIALESDENPPDDAGAAPPVSPAQPPTKQPAGFHGAVRLRSLSTSDHKDPLIILEIKRPGGASEVKEVFFEEPFLDGWHVSECNPSAPVTITVTDGEQIVIVSPGDLFPLPFSKVPKPVE